MSSEQVRKFLEEKENPKEQEKEKDLNQLRFKVLNHYNLGEKVFYKEGDNIEDFPFTVWDCGISKRYKYVCDISDEDFEKIYKIYKQEAELSELSKTSEINNDAEKILNVYALVALVVGIIAFVVCLIVAFDLEEWSLIVTGLTLALATLVVYAFVKVFVNISYKLDKIANLLNKPEK